jgi:tape measure domain-containing protein
MQIFKERRKSEMGMVTTAFALRDQMSQTLRQITPQVTRLTNGLGELHRTSENVFNPTAMSEMNSALNATINNYNTITYSARAAGNAQRQHNQEIRNSVIASNSLANSLRGALNAYMVIRGIKFTLGVADEFSSITARLGSIKDSLHTTNSLTKQVAESAIRARGDFSSMAQTVSRIAYTSKGLFSNKELVRFVENVQKGFVITGATADEASNAMLQLSQAMASGRMQGDELNSTLENNSAVSKALADHFGVSIGQLKELGSKGKITARDIKEALLNATDEINRDFEKMPLTFGQAMKNIKTQAQLAFAPVLWVVQQIGVNFASITSSVVSGFTVIAPTVYGLTAVIAAGFGAVALNIAITKLATYKLTGAIHALNVALGTTNQITVLTQAQMTMRTMVGVIGAIVLSISVAILFLQGLGLTINEIFSYAIGIIGSVVAVLGSVLFIVGLVKLAILGAAGAQAIWNAITASNPIVMIIFGIVTVLTLVIWCLHSCGITTSQVLGFMGGMFSMLYTFIKNILKNLWNGFSSVIEVLANWRHPIVAIAGFFAHMTSSVLDNIASVSGGFDKLGTWLGTAIAAGVNNAIDHLNALFKMLNNIPGINFSMMSHVSAGKGLGVSDSLRGLSKDINNKFDKWADKTTNGEYNHVKRFEMEDLGDSFNSGYKWGSNLDLTNMFKNPFGDNIYGDKANDKMDNYGANNPLTGGNKADKETAANTAKMAKTMEATQEDLKYLRDIAEQNTINNSTIEVKVDITNHNTINNDLDLDGVVEHLNSTIKEQVAIGAEGLYI